MNSIKAKHAAHLAMTYSKIVKELIDMDLDWSEPESQNVVYSYVSGCMEGYAFGYLKKVKLDKAELAVLDECIEFHKEMIIKLFKD